MEKNITKKKRSAGKKILIGATALVLVLAALAAGGLIYLNHYLGTESFRARLESEVRERSGVDLEIGDLSVSVFRGFAIRRLSVASPVEGHPPIFRAEEIVLSYNLRDLLSRRVTVDRILIDSPRIALRTDPEGNWILPLEIPEEEKPDRPPRPERDPPVEPPVEPPAEPPAESPWQIAVESFRIIDGSAEIFTGEAYDPVTISGLELTGRFLQGGAAGEAEARLEIGTVVLGGEEMVENLRADLTLKGGESLSAQLRSGAAAGRVAGGFEADLRDPAAIAYRGGLGLEGLDVTLLLRTFVPDLAMEVTGGIFGQFEFRGEAGDPAGPDLSGNLEIREGNLSGNQIQDLIATLLRDDEFRNIRFQQTEVVFNLSDRVATLERLIVHSRKTILSAAGTVDLARDSELDLTVGINLAEELVGDIRVRELRGAFRPAEAFPGYRVFDFKVWGTPDDLKNDFARRLVERGALPRLKEELLGRDRDDDPELTEEERARRREKREKREGQIEEGVDKIFRLFGQ